jgi:SAM-dependent methyltransferase
MAAACRFCATALEHGFVDLGMSPLSNAILDADALNRMEPFYPLRAYVCQECFLVQLEAFESPDEIFRDYSYFSSYSDSWLAHARAFAAATTDRFELGRQSLVVEVASNDGYLLQYFKEQGIPVLGVEPARNVAEVAIDAGIDTLTEFFGVTLARRLRDERKPCDLLVGNNVLAHVPDLNDFVAGLGILLADEGALSMEFPHLLQLIENTQFDTIYHEHFSYLSFSVVERIFAHHGITLFDVDELPTHGGSLRVYGCHAENTSLPAGPVWIPTSPFPSRSMQPSVVSWNS